MLGVIRVGGRVVSNQLSLGRWSVRGLKTAISEIRKGDWIEYEGKVVVVNSITSSFSGRGSRSYLMMVKDAVLDTITAVKPTSRDSFERLELADKTHQYLYETDGLIYFMDPKTLDEISVSKSMLSAKLERLLEGGMEVKIRMNNDKPVLIHVPNKNMKCTVAEVLEQRDSAEQRKSTVVLVQGGARVLCTGLINVGDQIIVSQDDLSFQGKAI